MQSRKKTLTVFQFIENIFTIEFAVRIVKNYPITQIGKCQTRLRNLFQSFVSFAGTIFQILVNQDLKNGSSETYEALKKIPQAGLALSYLRNRVIFDNAHGEFYREDILNELKNS